MAKVRVAVTADWHGYVPTEHPDCDLMVVAGDIGIDEVFGDDHSTLANTYDWLRKAQFPIVAIAGNHDFHPDILRTMPWTYLQDEAAEVCGLKIWGSPWSNPFGHGWAFNMSEERQREELMRVPQDTNIIISHGPPFSYGDLTRGYGDKPPEHVGSEALLERMLELPDLKLVACGHIHPGYGVHGFVVNGCLVDENYQVANEPIIVEVENGN